MKKYKITHVNIPSMEEMTMRENTRSFTPIEKSFPSHRKMMLKFIEMIAKGDWRIKKGPSRNMIQAIKSDGSVLIQVYEGGK